MKKDPETFHWYPVTKQHQRHRLADRKVPLNIKQCFFPVWMTEQWNRLPKELWIFLHWKYLKSDWIWFKQPALDALPEQGDGIR